MSGQHCENYDRKQSTVTREMLTAVARDQIVQLKMAWCCPLSRSKFAFDLLYNKSLNNWSLGEQWILFPETNKNKNNKILIQLKLS